MVYMYHSFLVHSSADGHLGCFHVLAMTNSAAMNIGVHVSLDYTDLCWQSNVSAFLYAVQIGHNFPSKEQVSFNFMVAVTICSDFGAPQNKVCHCFHCFPIYLP